MTQSEREEFQRVYNKIDDVVDKVTALNEKVERFNEASYRAVEARQKQSNDNTTEILLIKSKIAIVSFLAGISGGIMTVVVGGYILHLLGVKH